MTDGYQDIAQSSGTGGDSYELRINALPGEITSNLTELGTYLERVTERYRGQVVTPDQLRYAKDDLARLRKLKKALEDERKRAKEVIMAPYNELEGIYRTATASLDEAINGIDAQVKEIQAEEKRQKLAMIDEEMTGAAEALRPGLSELILQDRVKAWLYPSDWMTKAFTREKVRKGVEWKAQSFLDNLRVIETYARDGFESVRIEAYLNTGRTGEAMEAGNRARELAERKIVINESAPAPAPAPVEEISREEEKTDNGLEMSVVVDIPEPKSDEDRKVMQIPCVLHIEKYKIAAFRQFMTMIGAKIKKA